jgi:hypothetical protein
MVAGSKASKSRAWNCRLCSNRFSNDVTLISINAEPLTSIVLDPFRIRLVTAFDHLDIVTTAGNPGFFTIQRPGPECGILSGPGMHTLFFFNAQSGIM